MSTVVTGVPRPDRDLVDAFDRVGVATIHEAQGRKGLMAPRLRPILLGAHIAGTALTVSVPPGDNLMIHVAIEQLREGDILVVAPTSHCESGYFGGLLAVAALARGARGLVIDAGCRDVAELRDIGFPVWSRAVSAEGAVKETLGEVNLPVVCGERSVNPGDIIVADDDGVVVVPSDDARAVLEASHARDRREQELSRRYAAGELGLDVHSMRAALKAKGLRYEEHCGPASTA